MRKIPTLFVRDPDDRKHVLPVVHPKCQWVLNGEGTSTRKFDGTCVLSDVVGWWARREVKPGKEPPEMFYPVETDEETGKTVGWEPIYQSPFARYLDEAIKNTGIMVGLAPTTFELCGPKINGNPEHFEQHVLVLHGDEILDTPRDFEGLRAWLLSHDFEGIVWHHPDGRMAKLKKRDFPSG